MGDCAGPTPRLQIIINAGLNGGPIFFYGGVATQRPRCHYVAAGAHAIVRGCIPEQPNALKHPATPILRKIVFSPSISISEPACRAIPDGCCSRWRRCCWRQPCAAAPLHPGQYLQGTRTLLKPTMVQRVSTERRGRPQRPVAGRQLSAHEQSTVSQLTLFTRRPLQHCAPTLSSLRSRNQHNPNLARKQAPRRPPSHPHLARMKLPRRWPAPLARHWKQSEERSSCPCRSPPTITVRGLQLAQARRLHRGWGRANQPLLILMWCRHTVTTHTLCNCSRLDVRRHRHGPRQHRQPDHHHRPHGRNHHA